MRGIVAELQGAGYTLRPARVEISGDLPRGSGLSSSAALSTALALALLGLAGEPPPEDLRELAKLCSRVENDWVGQKTGLLDQFAALLGSEGHALRIDFRTLAVQPVPLNLGDWRLVTVESGASHSLAASGYNERRAECEAACAALGIASLRDATEADLPRLREPLRARARHVITENARVDAMAAALARSDMAAAGALLDASHASLRDDYASSVPEVEATVAALKAAGAAGARMVGGGFGGSVLALLGPGIALPAGAIEVTPGPRRRCSERELLALGLRQLLPQRPAERPDQEEAAHDEHPDARVEVDVDAGGLLDLGVAVGEPEDDQQDAPDDEQAADDAAQVEEVRRLRGAAVRGRVLGHVVPPYQKTIVGRWHRSARSRRSASATPTTCTGGLLVDVGHTVDEPLQLLDRLRLGLNVTSTVTTASLTNASPRPTSTPRGQSRS